MAHFVNHYVIDLSNIYIALLFSVFGFLLMMPIGYLSYTLVELPCLKFRTRYISAVETVSTGRLS